jgi:hypothetical protein
VKCKQYLRNFLSSLFLSADRLAQEELAIDKMTYECMARAFHDYFSDPPKRFEFYRGVVAQVQHKGSNRGTVWNSFTRFVTGLKQRRSNWPDTKKTCPILSSIDEVHVLYNLQSHLCQLHQDLTDRIYFPNYGGVSPKSISALLDQDKTGDKINYINVGIQSAEALSKFSHGNKLPYIAAVL